MPLVDDGSGPRDRHQQWHDEREVPDFQIATLAATANVLIEELGVGEDEAIQVAILIDTAQKEALAEFGPELTLSAAEVLWGNR